MEKTITEFMINEHNRIENIIIDLKKSYSQLENIKTKLNQLIWEIEKHFFIEEKVIFKLIKLSNEYEMFQLTNLLKDHKDMLYLIFEMKNTSLENIILLLNELETLLKSHAKTEEDIFYNKLDMNLNKEEKENIFGKLNDVI